MDQPPLLLAEQESVALAVTLRDGFEIRGGHTLSVQPAKFEQRGELVVKKAGKEEVEQRKKQKVLERRRLAGKDNDLTSPSSPRPLTRPLSPP